MKNRNIVTCILLVFVTCGIYGIYQGYNIIKDSSNLTGVPAAGGSDILTLLLCCTPYVQYWLYLTGQGFDNRGGTKLGTSNNAVLFLVFGLVGLGIVDFALIQNEINKVA